MSKKLLFTGDIKYDMSDWKREPIEKVFAGTDCILAITSDGRLLQKTNQQEYALRTAYWTRIEDVSLSGLIPCHAIGLVRDGTCMIAKRALRNQCNSGHPHLSFERINDTVKSWTQIVQVAVSDAYFALDRSGRVLCAPVTPYEMEDYSEVTSWTNVRRIEPGPQASILGVTNDGRVLAAGGNLSRDYDRRFISGLRDVADICTTGSECETIVFALKDGTVMSNKDTAYPVIASPERLAAGRSVFKSHFAHEVLVLAEGNRLVKIDLDMRRVCDVFEGHPSISSFAIGDNDYRGKFILAVAE